MATLKSQAWEQKRKVVTMISVSRLEHSLDAQVRKLRRNTMTPTLKVEHKT